MAVDLEPPRPEERTIDRFSADPTMPFFVYLLYSDGLKRHYIGQTSDVAKRLATHNCGLVRSTRRGRPWYLLGYETYESRSDARWRERQLKLHSDKKVSFITRLRQKACLENGPRVSDPEGEKDVTPPIS